MWLKLGWGRKKHRQIVTVFIPAALLLFAFGAAISSVRQISPTYDEYEYISRGYLYLKTGDTHLRLRHPVLLDVVAAAPLLLLPDIQLPLSDPSLAAGDFHVFARVFFWESNGSLADRMIFLARLPKIFLLLLLATAVYRWALEIFGWKAGLLALILSVFDPNLLAHGRLATPDVGQSFFIFLAIFAWWRFLKQPGWLRFILASIAFGLAQTAGFPALTLYPVLVLVTIGYQWPVRSRTQLLRPLATLIGLFVVSFLVIWAVYRFQWGVVGPFELSLPASYHWEELIALSQRLSREDLAYLNGDVYRGGRWQFFVIALLIKTPLPTFILMGLGIIFLVRRHNWLHEMALWLLPLVYYGTALIGSLNIGYRHILPVLPFAFVLAGGMAVHLTQSPWRKILIAGLLSWLVLSSLWIYPDYLAYFNESVGGPLGGKSHLVVSDLDWGQNLPGLGDYMQAHDVDKVFLSWFGTTPPEHYGIQYNPLPSWPGRGIPQQLPFHPDYPLPGMYAISAANLVGARFEDAPDTFTWFWSRLPAATIGYSIYIYQVPRLLDSSAPPVNVALYNLALADLPTAVIEDRLHTNDLIPRWFDASQAMIFPQGRTVILLDGETAVHPLLAERFEALMHQAEQMSSRDGERQIRYFDVNLNESLAAYLPANLEKTIYSSSSPAPTLENAQRMDAPVDFDTAVTFLGYEQVSKSVQPGDNIQLLSYWQVNEKVDAPLAIFVHFLAPDGSILAQFDGLGVASDYWYPGDVIVQMHQFPAPASVPEGACLLAIGLYRTDTLTRLPVAVTGGFVDRILLNGCDAGR